MSKKESESLSQVMKKKKVSGDFWNRIKKKTHTHTIETYEQIKQISFGFNTCI